MQLSSGDKRTEAIRCRARGDESWEAGEFFKANTYRTLAALADVQAEVLEGYERAVRARAEAEGAWRDAGPPESGPGASQSRPDRTTP